MNWILDTYSNLYTTAMMREQNHERHAATAKQSGYGRRLPLLRLLGRH
jgi:hypothetical protein